MAGGTPVEFGVIGACDGIAGGHGGTRYILPTRELIADSIEAMVEAHRFSGMVLWLISVDADNGRVSIMNKDINNQTK